MRTYVVLFFKILFFLMCSAVFSIPALLILAFRHGGIAGGSATKADTSFKAVLALVLAIAVPLILIGLLGWSLFSKKQHK